MKSMLIALFAGTGLVATALTASATPTAIPKGPMSTIPVVRVDCKNNEGSRSKCRAWCADYDKRTNSTGCSARNCTGCPNK